MASRIASLRNLVPEMEAALKSFQSSGSQFRILKTIQSDTSRSHEQSSQTNKPLLILDSSFNPPSIAHLTLAQSALKSSPTNRLCLLFATMNADKAPSPAPFQHRLAMMALLAQDLLSSLQQETESNPDKEELSIDVAVTTAPYYNAKSAAISDSEAYPSHPRHTHLLGFDTITRFFNPKYYASTHDPPLSALAPFFEAGHRLRVTLRPDESNYTLEDQKSFVDSLANGSMEKDGAKREWAQQVELVDPNPRAGVSSTRVREAAKKGQWKTVEELCTPQVAEWVRTYKLYEGDATGAKMA